MSFYLMHRKWMDNPALGGVREPFCKRAAWAWMIEEAAWQERRVDAAGKTITLQRGQLSHTTRFMAKAWGWPETNVRRFLDRLKTDAMIGAESGAGPNVVTICNYDMYQAPQEETGAADGAEFGARSAQDRRKIGANEKEGNKGTREQKTSLRSDVVPPPDLLGGGQPVLDLLPEDPDELPAAVVAWNALATAFALPKVQKLTSTRRAKLRARLRDCGGMTGWEHALSKIRQNTWMHGANDRGWKASFNFLLQDDSFTQLMEGGYDRTTRTADRPASPGQNLAAAGASLLARFSQDAPV